MVNSYFLIAWRSLVKNSKFYFVNIFGLSIGLACCLLIGSHVYNELSYDTDPERAKDIYRLQIHVLGNGVWSDYASVDYGVGPGVAAAYPEVESFTRLSKAFQGYLKYKETVLKEDNMALVDSNFLEFFSIPLIEGNDRTALTEPNSLVISRAFAKKYFGDEDPIGKSINVNNRFDLKITGMVDKVPDNSHFKFDAFISGSTFGKRRESWSNIGEFTYVRLSTNANPDDLKNKLPDLVMKHVVPEIQQDMGVSLAEAQKAVSTFVFDLQPLTSIHLYSHTATELGPNGDVKYIYIFTALALFILVLACINFVNLSTATSAKRAREVGIRKVMGSVKIQLVYQFLTESVLLAGGALLLAYGFVLATLPFFNQLTGGTTAFNFFLQPLTLGLIVVGVIFIGIVAGIYPSFFLSSFNTISVLKGNTAAVSGKREGLRSALVVFQFAVSTTLIAGTLVVYQQLDFMQNKDLGYNKEQVIVIQETRSLRDNERAFKDQLTKDSRVINASIARHVPAGSPDGTQAFPKDNKEGESSSEIHIDIFRVDYNYLNTLGIAVAYGRNFSEDFPSDSAAVVINETAAQEFGWDPESAIGKSIIASGQTEYHVVGVVKDFNYASVRQKVGPLVMMLRYNSGSIVVKLNATDVHKFLEDTKTKWASFTPDTPFTYSFLDEKFAALYVAEQRTGKIFTTFAFIALIIAGLGLFGLSTFAAEQRTREIGIRKVLGASVQEVLFMLSKQFLALVLIGLVIAIPVTAWAMNQWLLDFAYRIKIAWWLFAIAGVISFLIAFLSMGFQVMKAAVANPVTSLKNE